MNERIRLLAEQAGLVGGGYANGTKIMTWRESFDNPGSLEKFAELIVRECANVAKKEQAFNARYTDTDQHPQVNIDQCILIEFGL